VNEIVGGGVAKSSLDIRNQRRHAVGQVSKKDFSLTGSQILLKMYRS